MSGGWRLWPLGALVVLVVAGNAAAAPKPSFLGILLDTGAVDSEVRAVAEGSSADTAGIRPGDVIKSFDKDAIATRASWVLSLTNAMNAGGPGTEIELGVRRDCVVQKFRMKLEAPPAGPVRWKTGVGCPSFAWTMPLADRRRLVEEENKHTERAFKLRKKGRLKEAIAEYRRALDSWPWEHSLSLAQTLREAGDLEGAAAEENRVRACEASLAKDQFEIPWLGISGRTIDGGGAAIMSASIPGKLVEGQALSGGEVDVIHEFNSAPIVTAADLVCAAAAGDPDSFAGTRAPEIIRKADEAAREGRREEAIAGYRKAEKLFVDKSVAIIRFTHAGQPLNWFATINRRPDSMIAELRRRIWEQQLSGCRASGTNPPVDGDARRYKALAENAVREKRFEDAAKYYASAVDAQPCWPQGHFNLAVLDGELGYYDPAAFHMHRYLDLVPNARDAGAAQDKIFVWEEKAKAH